MLITFSSNRPAWLYTGSKCLSLSVPTGQPGSILVANAYHFQFQQASLALYWWQRIWQRIITFSSCRPAWFYTGSKCLSLSVPAGQPCSILVAKLMLINFSSNRPAWLYTGGKCLSLSVPAGQPDSILVAKVPTGQSDDILVTKDNHFQFLQASLILYWCQILTT